MTTNVINIKYQKEFYAAKSVITIQFTKKIIIFKVCFL